MKLVLDVREVSNRNHCLARCTFPLSDSCQGFLSPGLIEPKHRPEQTSHLLRTSGSKPTEPIPRSERRGLQPKSRSFE